MNFSHRHLCASTAWFKTVRTAILPWVLDGVDLGFEVVEVGPGYGAATDWLRTRAGHLTCVEIDPALCSRLASQLGAPNLTVLCENATRMSLADSTCDGAVSLTMLHHLPSPALQDQLLAEVARVLRPGGVFVGFDVLPGPLVRLLHAFDTMVVIRRGTQRAWDQFYSLGNIWERSRCVTTLKSRLAFVLVSKLYRQMYANTGIATDSARVGRSARWARWIAQPCRRLFAAKPMPDLSMPA